MPGAIERVRLEKSSQPLTGVLMYPTKTGYKHTQVTSLLNVIDIVTFTQLQAIGYPVLLSIMVLKLADLEIIFVPPQTCGMSVTVVARPRSRGGLSREHPSLAPEPESVERPPSCGRV